jgi:phosphoglycolate phosphatase
MGKPKTLIFDFDGTLADTLHIAVSVFRELAPKRKTISDSTVEKLRSLPAKEAMHAAGVRWWNLPYLAYRARKSVRNHMVTGNVKTFAGITAVLSGLQERGYRLIVVSSNSHKNIELFLRANKLEAYFESFYGGVGVFSKAGALTKLVRDKGLKLEECCYIGDEVRDAESARQAHMRFVGVTWGYNNRQALQNAKAETLVDEPKDLLKLFVAKP